MAYTTIYRFTMAGDRCPWAGTVSISDAALVALQDVAPSVFGVPPPPLDPDPPGPPVRGPRPVRLPGPMPAGFPRTVETGAATAIRYGDMSAETDLLALLGPLVASALRLDVLDPFGELEWILAKARPLSFPARALKVSVVEDLDGALVSAYGDDFADVVPARPAPPAPGFTGARKWSGFVLVDTTRRSLRADGVPVVTVSAGCGLNNGGRLGVRFKYPPATNPTGPGTPPYANASNEGTVHGHVRAYVHAADGDDVDTSGLQGLPILYALPFVFDAVDPDTAWAERLRLRGVDRGDGIHQPGVGRGGDSLAAFDVERAAAAVVAAFASRMWLDMDGAWHVEHVAAMGDAFPAGTPAGFVQRFERIAGQPAGRRGEVAVADRPSRRFELEASDVADSDVFYFDPVGCIVGTVAAAYEEEEIDDDDTEAAAFGAVNRNPQFWGVSDGGPTEGYGFPTEFWGWTATGPDGLANLSRPKDSDLFGPFAYEPGARLSGPFELWQYVGQVDAEASHGPDFSVVSAEAGPSRPLALDMAVGGYRLTDSLVTTGAQIRVQLALVGNSGRVYYAHDAGGSASWQSREACEWAEVDPATEGVDRYVRFSFGMGNTTTGMNAGTVARVPPSAFATVQPLPEWGRLYIGVQGGEGLQPSSGPDGVAWITSLRLYWTDTVTLATETGTVEGSAPLPLRPNDAGDRRFFSAMQTSATSGPDGVAGGPFTVRPGSALELPNGVGFHGPVVQNGRTLLAPSGVEYDRQGLGLTTNAPAYPAGVAFPTPAGVLAADFPVAPAPLDAAAGTGGTGVHPAVSGVGTLFDGAAAAFLGLTPGGPRRLTGVVPGFVGVGFALVVPVEVPGGGTEPVEFVVVATEYVFATDATSVVGVERAAFGWPSAEAFE